jgi:phenylpropionate dioxygenase-like ring-hydroxylating dioxygenase large terminal subunit
MYINFWYPIAESDEVTNEAPVRARILGLDFVAFRDTQGKANVLSDTCIHRGAALGAGKIKDDCVQCPYHGWQYDGDGRCTVIPSLGDGEKLPARAKVDSYPVQEKYGIVFAFLGDLPAEERLPIYEIPEYEDENWRANKNVVFEVDYYYERSVENGLDAAHNEFVHPKQGAPGMVQDFRNKPIDVQNIGDWGSKFMIPFEQISSKDGLLEGDIERKPSELEAGSGHFGPNTLITWLHLGGDNKFHQYFFEAPIDENRTRIFFVNMRRFMLEPEMDEKIVAINMEIAQEDINVLVNLNPVRTPETTTKELLVPSDRPVVRYREFLDDWEKRGWRIDMQRLAELRGDAALAIPSPARRTEKNWILDEIPRVDA